MKRTKSQIKPPLALIALGALNVLLWSPPALALDPSLDITQYAHTSWTFRNGFLNGAVYAIAQTPDGYLWLGTQSGVVRFDGVRGVPLALPPGQQLPSSVVSNLLAARDGTLWIGTLDGLASWKNGRLTPYAAIAGYYVNALLEDRDGTVWAGGFGRRPGRLCAIRSESTTCYGGDGIFGDGVASLYEDAEGSLWVGATTGLWRWNPGPPTNYISKPLVTLQALTQGDRGSGLIVASDSVRQIVGRNVMDYPLRGAPSPLTAQKLLRDRDGGLWVGTWAHGLVHSHEGKTSLFSQHDGLTSDRVLALFEDREGTIWVATPEGLDQFRESPVTSLSVPEGLSSSIATSVLAARDGSIWIGTADGLNRWKSGRITIYRKRSDPGLPDDEIQSLFEDERGRIWVSGFHGLAVFENERFTAVPSAPPGGVHAIAGDNRGGLWLSLWVSSGDYGLVHLVNGKIVEQMLWQKVGGGAGSGLVTDSGGGVWTGLIDGGMAHFHNGEIRQLSSSKDGLGAGRVFNLGRSRDGSLWAATENGLSRITHGRIATLTTANGLPCNSVHWVIEDDLSSYWLYTRCGLVRIARTDLDAWAADPKRTIHATTFDSADGIRLVAMLKGARPHVTKSSDGKIWFVNGDTLSFMDPSHIGINTLPPPVHIEQITADGKTYDATRGLRLPPHVRNLTIDFTALSLVAPHKVHFRYKLEGQDPDWREVINEREVQYSNLSPRNYRFRVTASNNSGVWNEKGDVLDFSIAPAYYQTNWFRALCAAMFLALLWAAYRFRVHQLQRESKQLRDVIDTIPGSVWSARPDGSLDFINRRWLEFSGVSLEKGLGQGWEATVHPDDLARFSDEWRAAVACGKTLESEARVRTADGQYRWLLIRSVPLHDKRGKVVKWYGTSTDIDDRKQAEDALRRSQAYLTEAQLLSRTGSFGWKPSTGEIQWSEETYRIFQYDPMSKPTVELVLERVHPEDRARTQQTIQRASQEGKDFEHEYRLLMPDGSVKYLHIMAHALSDEAGGIEFVGAAMDITAAKQAEERLRQSEAGLRQLIDAIPQQVSVFDANWNPLFANQREREYTGLTPEEAQSKDALARIFHPDDLKKLEALRERMLSENVPSEMETRIRGKDGQYRWFLIRDNPLRDEQGRVLRWYGTSTDIDDRKRAEEALRRLNRELRAISNCNQSLLRATDEQSLLEEICRIVCEEAGYRIAWVAYAEHDEAKSVRPVGWAGNEEGYLAAAGITWADTERGRGPTGTAIRTGKSCCIQDIATDPRFAPWRESALERGFRSGIGLPLKDEHANAFGSLTIHSAQPNAFTPEEIRLLEELAADLAFGIVTLRSRAARKQAEEALREGETRFRTFVDHAPDALFIYDFEQGTIVDVNRLACESLGYTRQELIGTPPLAFDRNEDRAATESVAERTAAGETVIDTHWHRRKDGTLFPVEVHTSQYWYGGRRFLLKVARDISDRLRTEEERERLRQVEAELAHLNRVSMLGELAVSIAHEVNQPLSGVVVNGNACLRWLAGDPPNLDEAREAVRRIVRDGKRAGEVIARIRALTKRAATPREELNLNDTLREVLALVGDEAKKRNVIIRTQFADDLSPVSGDRVQLQQVGLNLIMNGMEAMSGVEQRPRELVMTTRNIDADQVQVTVRDSGIGLDPNTMGRIFDPFYTTKPSGMGMGLSISRSIVQAHGGRLWATANDGPGTSLHFTLPKYHDEESKAGV